MDGWIVIEAAFCRTRPSCLYIAFRPRHPRRCDWQGVLIKRTISSEAIEIGDDVNWITDKELLWTPAPRRGSRKKICGEIGLQVIEGGPEYDHPDRVMDYSEQPDKKE